jgi:hypothetical protein
VAVASASDADVRILASWAAPSSPTARDSPSRRTDPAAPVNLVLEVLGRHSQTRLATRFEAMPSSSHAQRIGTRPGVVAVQPLRFRVVATVALRPDSHSRAVLCCRGGAGAQLARPRGGRPRWRDTPAESGRAPKRRRSCDRRGVHARGPRRERRSPAGQRRSPADRTRPPPAAGPRNPRDRPHAVLPAGQRQVEGAVAGPRAQCEPQEPVEGDGVRRR